MASKNSMKRCCIVSAAVAAHLMTLLTQNASGTLILSPELTAQDANALVAMEATQFGLAATAWDTGQSLPPQDLGTWTGTITSTGWSLDFVGSMNGTTLNLQQIGQLDLPNDKATWADTGLYGLDPVTGSGEITFDPFWKTFWKVLAGVTIVGGQALTTAGSLGTTVVLDKLLSVSSAAIVNGIIDDHYNSQSQVTKPPNSTTSKVNSNSSPGPNSQKPVRIYQTGTLNQTTGVAQFTSTATPEPGSFTMALCAGIIASMLRKSRSKPNRRLA